ncbi:MAG: AI-2E family transporter [Actinobacteria bacterium]|nr:AI-2E family transporter [Actinomycetota bacterium]
MPEPAVDPPGPDRRLRLALDWRTGVGIAVLMVGLRVVVDVASTASTALTRIGVGVLLAFALEPLVRKLEVRGWTRAAAVATVGGAFVLAFAVLAAVALPPGLRQAERLRGDLPDTVRGLYDLPLVGRRLQQADAVKAVQGWVDDLPSRFDFQRVRDLARSLASGAASLGVVLLVAFAVLLDGPGLVRRVRLAIPEERRERADEIGRLLYQVVGTYFAGSVFVACIGGTYVLVVGLLLGVPLAPIAAVWYAMVSLIPQVGGFLGTSFVFVLAVSQGLGVGLLVLLLVVAYMNTENYVISPAIVGRAVDLSPPTTMLAALVGGAALGVPGALAATPLCGTVKALYLRRRFGELPDIGGPGRFVERLPAPLRRLVERLRAGSHRGAGDAQAGAHGRDRHPGG